jgi:hypothetical protein
VFFQICKISLSFVPSAFCKCDRFPQSYAVSLDVIAAVPLLAKHFWLCLKEVWVGKLEMKIFGYLSHAMSRPIDPLTNATNTM